MREGFILILWVDRWNHIFPNISRISTSHLTFQKGNGPYIREITVHFMGILFQNFFKCNTYFCTTIKLFTEHIILYWYSYNEVQRARYAWEWNIVNLATVLSKQFRNWLVIKENLIYTLRFCNWGINPFTDQLIILSLVLREMWNVSRLANFLPQEQQSRCLF